MNKKSENKYPTLKIITLYPLLGGLVGGSPLLITSAFMWVISGFTGKIPLWVLIVMVWVFGFIPALLTGAVLAYFKIKILKFNDYFKAFWAGFGITFICFSIAIIIMEIIDKHNRITIYISLSEVFTCLIFSLIGGISSVILAKFLLPKS